MAGYSIDISTFNRYNKDMTTLPGKHKFDQYVKLGLLTSQCEGDLTVYQYSRFTQYDRLWNSVTLAARGIVFDHKERVIQRCLPKFFNSTEPEGIIATKMLTASKPVVQEKLDGSLIKVSQDPQYGLVVTSKCSFTSKYAMWAREIIEEKGYKFAPGLTYHFELIHPENRVVLDYADQKDLILFAVVINENGHEKDIYSLEGCEQFLKAKLLPEDVLSEVNKLNESGLQEGVVVNFGTYRLKIKTDDYVRLHRIITEYTPKRVWEALKEGKPIDKYEVPEEFLEWIEETEGELLRNFNEFNQKIIDAVESTKDLSNKEIGLSNNPYKAFIFAVRNGFDYDEAIWDKIKPKEKKENNGNKGS